MCVLIDFASYARAKGREIRLQRELPVPGEIVSVHRPDGSYLGSGEVIRRDPIEPYAAVLINGCTFVLHMDNLRTLPGMGVA